MKKRTLIGIVLVLLLCSMRALTGSANAEDGKKYRITVTGGHAEDSNGNVITEAEAGADVHLVSEQKSGTYVEYWNVSGTKESGGYIIMPEEDVDVVAVRKPQTPLTIDLGGFARVPEVRYGDEKDYVWMSVNEDGANNIPGYLFACADRLEDYRNGVETLDVDGDGTPDIRILIYPGSVVQEYIYPVEGASAKGSITFNKPSEIPYWPITLKFNTKPLQESYSIKVVNGEAYDENGTAVTSAAPGQWITLHFPENDSTYLKHWEADGHKNFYSYYYCADSSFRTNTVGMNEFFPMPCFDMTIRAVTSVKKPYTIDLTNGCVRIGYDQGICLMESIPGEGVYYGGNDLDGDGKPDIYTELDPETKEFLIIPYGDSSVGGTYTLKGTNKGAYWPVTVKFGELKPAYNLNITGGHAEDLEGNIITSAAALDTVWIVADKQADGVFFKFWKSDYEGVKKEQVVFPMMMPAADMTITAETVAEQTPYTIDFTSGTLQDADIAVIVNLVYANGFDARSERFYRSSGGEESARYGYFDLDGDGRDDVVFGSRDDEGYGTPWNRVAEKTFAERPETYSLWKSRTIDVKDGAYGPVTFVVDVEKANAEAEKYLYKTRIFEPEHSFLIEVEGGYATRVGETDNRAFIVPEGSRVDINPWTDGYIYDWDTDGVEFHKEGVSEGLGVYGYLIMPSRDLKVVGITEKPAPTPTPTPTPTVAPTKEPTKSVTESTPAPTGSTEDKKDSKDDEDGINPLFIIIPFAVVLAGIITMIMILNSRKGKPDAAKAAEVPTENKPTEEAPTENEQTAETPVESEQTAETPQESKQTGEITQENESSDETI